MATFTSYELMEYEEFIRYVVIVSMVALPRHQLWSDILNGSEILEVLHTDQSTKQYALAFYNSHFDKVRSLQSQMKSLNLHFSSSADWPLSNKISKITDSRTSTTNTTPEKCEFWLITSSSRFASFKSLNDAPFRLTIR